MEEAPPMVGRGIRENSEWEYLWRPTYCILESLPALPSVELLIFLTRKYKAKQVSLSNPGRIGLLP